MMLPIIKIILNNESIIESSRRWDLSSLAKFESRFNALLYDEFKGIDWLLNRKEVALVYLIKSGANDGLLILGLRDVVHSVFHYRQLNVVVRAYVSDWLSRKASHGELP
jgi:hypothetical protein